MQDKIILPLLFVIFVASPLQAKMYKWVDDQGRVHYSDQVPAEHLKKERAILNEQGTTVKKIDAALTPAQKKERYRREQARKKLEAKEREKKLRDRVLLETYTTERDLIIARDARLDAVDSQIQLTASIIENATSKMEKTENRIENIRTSGKEVPVALYAKLEREKMQLASQQSAAVRRKEERKKIDVQFSEYVIRFRELKKEQKKRREEREYKARYK